MSPRPTLVLAAMLVASVAPVLAASSADVFSAQTEASALVAAALAARSADLSCRPLIRKLSCTVGADVRSVVIAAAAHRVYYTRDGSAKIQVLEPDITIDYDAYYEFDRSTFEAAQAGARKPLRGSYVERDDRVPETRTPAVCTVTETAPNPYYGAFAGTLDLGTKTLTNSRSKDAVKPIDARRTDVVDERCGALPMPLRDNLNWYVTPRHYWGEDILQVPESALSSGGLPFQANLHTCQYDGEWHASDDTALLCTLTVR